MQHVDEKIIAMLAEKEEETESNSVRGRFGSGAIAKRDTGQDLLKMIMKIDDEFISFEEKSLLDGQLTIALPKKFAIMPEKLAELKYPNGRRPSLIYSNEAGSINLSLNHTQSPLEDSDLADFQSYMAEILQTAQPGIEWLGKELPIVNGTPVGTLEFVVPALDVEVYNLLFFLQLDQRALLCTFNCTEYEMQDWQPIARGIMHSLKITGSGRQTGGMEP
ncbi:hypothetical protein [Brevibacillus dissolubilis]|uniref:hypothetical protein n=1 Tax=Brevibacillus dissolubilis TaxID=1844116 RepID=UPI001115C7DA|nr:hypothetical protein [Brevibacillus dissolubilis]